jgi:hypothetical protein
MRRHSPSRRGTFDTILTGKPRHGLPRQAALLFATHVDEGGPVSEAADAVGVLAASWQSLVAAQGRLHDVRDRAHRNFDGGDAGHQWDHGLVVRHAVNYAVAVHLASTVRDPGPLIDVGAGAGGFSVWAARALDRALVIVDQDAGHRDLAARAFPDVAVHASTAGLAPAPVVLAMEVIEHVRRERQPAFIADVASLVHPGGVLVMSTPDESGYWGGWSGYPPHISTLDADALGGLLHDQLPGWDVQVLRIDGPGFSLSTLGRVGVPVANRLWGAVENGLPRVAHELSYRMNQLGRRRSDPGAPDPGAFRVSAASSGSGTGLVAAARRPAGATS